MWKTIMENNLMKTGNEGRSTITKIFKNHNLRFIEIDGERMCIVKDINEAHRFAVSYQRVLRNKEALS